MKAKKLIGACILSVIAFLMLIFLAFKDHSQTIGQNEFEKLLQGASDFQVDENYIYFLNHQQQYKVLKEDRYLQKITSPIQLRKPFFTFWIILPICLFGSMAIIGFYFWRYKRTTTIPVTSAPTQIPTSTITPSQPQTQITLESLAGISNVKKELKEIIDYLKNPKKYTDLGLRLPKGILLVGPPGVGKTMIAKALASEAKVPFFYQSGSSFAQIFVGSGAKRVQELFSQAKSHPSAMIFIDEIDSVGKVRGNGRSDERESTLNQLLVEIDGFSNHANLIVIGATNNAGILDPALLRSGRFDRKIYIDLPTLEERIEIFKLYLKRKSYEFHLEEFAKDCAGLSGASIENLINEAGFIMLEKQRTSLTLEDMLEAKHKITLSLKKYPALNADQREILAIYQSAKALYAYFHQIEFEKVSLWEEESLWKENHLFSQTQLFSQIKLYLSGSQALKLLYHQGFTCSSEDIQKAKTLTQDYFTKYAMGSTLFDHSCEALILQAQKELQDFFSQKQTELESLKNLMLQKEYLDLKEINAIF